MDLHVLRTFFLGCTIINAAFLAYAFLMLALCGNWIYRMHTKWFSLSRETFNTAMYSMLGLYKLAIIFFNLVPYIVLLILG